ncbi:MAG: hypothetical protein CMF59_00635 [Leptospiraceae bacterium]|nr:hypothetical protein [Leptospiraceae bacterium]
MIFRKQTILVLFFLFALQPLISEPSSGNDRIIELDSNLSGNPQVTREGYFTLQWELLPGVELQKPTDSNPGDRLLLLESRTPEMDEPTIFHDEQNMSLAMSGKVDGDLYYRIFLLRPVQDSEKPGVAPPAMSSDALDVFSQYNDYRLVGYSNTLHIEVDHYSLSTAFIYFGIGAFLFLITTAVIIIGTYKSGREEV